MRIFERQDNTPTDPQTHKQQSAMWLGKGVLSILGLVLLCGNVTVSAQVSSEFSANQQTTVEMGVDGNEATLNASIAGELGGEINSSIGNENLGADAGLKARLEYLAGVEAKAGMWLDEQGLTIGVDAKAGAYVKADVEATFRTRIFGIEASVTASASASAGISAEASAYVKIGYDGMVEFSLSAGVALELGFSVGLSFSLDVFGLMDALGIADLETLLEWIDDFIKDPESKIDDLLDDASDAVLDYVGDFVADKVDEALEAIADGLLGWLGFGDDKDDIPPPPPDDTGDIRILPRPNAPGGSTKAYESAPELQKYRK